jgi:hypothetical protein
MPWTMGDVDHIPHDPALMSKKITIMSARRKRLRRKLN